MTTEGAEQTSRDHCRGLVILGEPPNLTREKGCYRGLLPTLSGTLLFRRRGRFVGSNRAHATILIYCSWGNQPLPGKVARKSALLWVRSLAKYLAG